MDPDSPIEREAEEDSVDNLTPDDMRFNTAPNILTLARIAFAPVVIGLLFMKDPRWDLAAAIVFGVASITDYFDGYLARVQKSVTVYGKLMDPLADKFLVVSALVMLQHLDRIHPVVVMLLICRELGITALRALASAEGVIIAASTSGKWKTAAQMVAIPLIMIYQPFFGISLFAVGEALLYFSLFISLWSAVDYVVDFIRALRKMRVIKREAKRAQRAKRKRGQEPVS